jgi:hypothetical protein
MVVHWLAVRQARVRVIDCMNVCIVTENNYTKKEWHKAIKPLKMYSLVM